MPRDFVLHYVAMNVLRILIASSLAAIASACAPNATTPPTADAGPSDPDAAASETCGHRVDNYLFARAYADTAAWNVPVCGLKKWSENDEYVNRFWFFSNNRDADPTIDDPNRGFHAIDFGLDPATDYAAPVYDAANATTTRLVTKRSGWPGTTNIEPTETIPWNPAWRASEGTDATLIILDHQMGREWNFWGLVQHDPITNIYNDSQCWLVPGYNANTHFCSASTNLIRTPKGDVADYRTYGGNFPSRGVRIQFFAMLTMPEEVAAGEIRHALAMGAANTMFGPECTADELNTPAAGTTCAYALAPAGGLEWKGPCTACPPSSLSDLELRKRSIPEGIRFALELSDGDIETWLDARGYFGQLRETARIFAVALRDYGWLITDTGGVAGFGVAGSANPATRDAWKALGIEGSGKDLLKGLITKERLWVVEPAVNQCADGSTTHYGCIATTTGY